ncbi:MAG: LysR family transcriptional regulator [Marinobacter sp.]|uniref:LysR family transcriptional regulator n=1 Tax=Marinobacter sp. TaxID=50741 RepID=UPI003F9616FE
MVELKQIKHFVAVAEELSFRRAAERLHITQPPLSQSIKKLEDTLGVKLFERNTRGVHLTKAGEAFLGESLQVLSAAHRSVNVARQAAHGEIGTLRIGYSASAIFSKTLTSALANLLTDRPLLNLELCEGNALFHIESLKDGKLDAAILRANLDEDSLSGLSVSRLGIEPLFVILNPGHRLQERSSIDFRELDGERFLLQPATQRTFLRRQLETLADKAGISISRVLEVPDIGSTLCFVGAGIGITILPASVASMAHGLIAIPLTDEGFSQPLILACMVDNPLSEQLRNSVGHSLDS